MAREFVDFLGALLQDGRARLNPIRALTESELRAGDVFLQEAFRVLCLELPPEPPDWVPEVGRWAACQFYRASQLVPCGSLPPEQFAALLKTECPAADPAGQQISVFLVFQYLPDLLRFARGTADDHPLVPYLLQWARRWPLTSVGILDVSEVDAQAERQILEQACLRQLYVDRIVARQDRQRLACPRVREAIQSTVGSFPELAGSLASEWKPPPGLSPRAPHSENTDT